MSKLTIEEAISRINKYRDYGVCQADFIEAVISDNYEASASCVMSCIDCKAGYLVKLLESIDIESRSKSSTIRGSSEALGRTLAKSKGSGIDA